MYIESICWECHGTGVVTVETLHHWVDENDNETSGFLYDQTTCFTCDGTGVDDGQPDNYN